MERVSKSAMKDKPKKPINSVFKFRQAFFKTLDPSIKHRNERAMIAYEDLSDKEKEKLEKEFRKEMETYDDKIKAWRKKHGI